MADLAVPAARLTTIDLRRETAVDRHLSRNLRRLAVTTAAEHLERAAAALRQGANVDALMLAGHKTTEVLAALGLCADQLDARPLPPEVVAAVPELRRWSLLLKGPPQPIALQSSETYPTGRTRKLTL
jgi:hypothetical protein